MKKTIIRRATCLALCLLLTLTMTVNVNALSPSVDTDVVSSNIAKLTNYISTHGEIQGNDRYIRYGTQAGTAIIKYNRNSNNLVFYHSLTDSSNNLSSESSFTMNVPYADTIYPKVKVSWGTINYSPLDFSNYYAATGQATLDPSDYCGGENAIQFTVSTKTTLTDSGAQSALNLEFDYAVSVWNALLEYLLGIGIESIGFTQKCDGHSLEEINKNGIDYDRCTKCGQLIEKVYVTSYVKSFKVSKGKKCFTAKWKKQSKKNLKKFNGYQIRYSTDPGMTGAITKNIGKKKASIKIKGLAKKTRYYVQLRTYTGGSFSKWSTKSVITK